MTNGTNSQSGTESDLTAQAVIAATAKPILEFGRGWMVSPLSAERAAELELAPGFGFWVNGRAGAMGDVEADVAAAAIGFMAPELVQKLWAQRPQGMGSRDLASAYAAMAAEWARPVLAGMEQAELEQLVELCDKVADAALPSSGALFAGWRTLPRPGDPAGDATVALNVLRELRGGAHLSAVHAVGLGPHGSIMATDDPVRGGQPWAERFGWTAPHPAGDTSLRAEAERITDEICIPAYEALDATERRQFVDLVGRARTAIDEM